VAPLVKLDCASPVAALCDYVRYFQQREARIAVAAVVYPIAARPEQILEFYLRQRYLVRDYESGAEDLAPRAVVVGPCTYRRAELVLHGHFEVFTIHFHASGFYRLFRHDIPAMRELFADDAHWVNIVGWHWPGKSAVVAGHQTIHRTFFQDTGIELLDVAIRAIAPTVAVAVVLLKVGPFTPPDGVSRPESEDRLSFVLTKREGRWLRAIGWLGTPGNPTKTKRWRTCARSMPSRWVTW
jgi:uncharacterized protein (TIGR02246 family)